MIKTFILLVLFSYPDSAVVVDTVFDAVCLGEFPGNRPLVRRGDTLYLAYPEKYINTAYQEGTLLFSYSVDNGQTWSTPIRVSPWDSLGGDEANLFFDKQGKLHCVWRQATPYNPPPYNTIYVVHSIYENGSWTFPETLSNSMTNTSGFSSVVVDSSGVIHVVYDDQVSPWGNYDIFYTRYENGSWTTPENLSNDPYDSAFPSLTIDSKQRLHLVWRRRYPNSLRPIIYRRYENGTWTPPEVISDTFYGGGAAIVADFNDNVHVVFGGGVGKIYHTVLIGTTWTYPSLVFESDSGWALEGNISVDSSNILYLIWWQEYDPIYGYYEIYYSTYDGNAWSSPLNLTKDSLSSDYPHLGNPVTSKGVDLVWTAADTVGIMEILYMKLRTGMINIKERVKIPSISGRNYFKDVFKDEILFNKLLKDIEIFDISGRKVKRLKGLKPGIYIYHLKRKNLPFIKGKFIKIK